jgi:hypothetical protein
MLRMVSEPGSVLTPAILVSPPILPGILLSRIDATSKEGLELCASRADHMNSGKIHIGGFAFHVFSTVNLAEG